MPSFKQVTIVGLGLIGGSLGMAIRQKRLAQTVVGFSRKPETMKRAKARGAIDAATADLVEAVLDADLVILAAPISQIISLGQKAAKAMKPGSILTDVGSTKGEIVRALEHAVPQRVAFVGAHPIAGSELSGIDAASADIFDAGYCILTPTPRTDPAALKQVESLWKAIASRVVRMNVLSHDRRLAVGSHLPHLLAFILTAMLPKDFEVPRSFVEMTRIAKSDPDLWIDIFASNRKALIDAFNSFEANGQRLATLLQQGRYKVLRRELARIQSIRKSLDRT